MEQAAKDAIDALGRMAPDIHLELDGISFTKIGIINKWGLFLWFTFGYADKTTIMAEANAGKATNISIFVLSDGKVILPKLASDKEGTITMALGKYCENRYREEKEMNRFSSMLLVLLCTLP